MRVLALAFVLSLIAVSLAKRTDCDVAIIGGGASGANTAVFLKDKGYKVCLFEKEPELGGNCNTYKIPASQIPPNCPTCPDYVDLGVVIVENTSYIQQQGWATYDVKTDQLLARFVSSSKLRSIDFTLINYDLFGLFDFRNGFGPILANPSDTQVTQDVIDAYGTLVGILLRYPWIEQIGSYPATIPRELLIPFNQFVANYNLFPLVNTVFKPLLFGQGLASWDKLTTFYALYNVKLSLLALTQPSRAGISIVGGCGTYYNEVANFLGSDSVFLNARVTEVNRPGGANNNGVIKVKASIAGGPVRTWKVDRLIISMAPKVSNLEFMDPDESELNLWRKVNTRVYWPSWVDVAGPINNQNTARFNFFGIEITNPPFLLPSTPSLASFFRNLPYGPAVAIFIDDDQDVSIQNAQAVVSQQLQLIPSSLVTSANVSFTLPHQFEPYFNVADLSTTPHAFHQFQNKQGYRNTFYVGGLYAPCSGTSQVVEHAYDIVNEFF